MFAEKQTYYEHPDRLKARFNRLRRKIGGAALATAAGSMLAVTYMSGFHTNFDNHHRIEAVGFDADMTTSEIARVGVNMIKREDDSPYSEDSFEGAGPVDRPDDKLQSISGVDSPIPTTYVDIETVQKIDQYFHINS